jgi:hypothetical protein
MLYPSFMIRLFAIAVIASQMLLTLKAARGPVVEKITPFF